MAHGRIFNCARCHQQVTLCSHCDRGNIYCGPSCSKAARQQSVKAAGRRYQSTLAGKRAHAKRQKRYAEARETVLKDLTHHGIQPSPPHDVLRWLAIKAPPDTCHRCGRTGLKWLRTGWLRHSEAKKTPLTSSWPLGP